MTAAAITIKLSLAILVFVAGGVISLWWRSMCRKNFHERCSNVKLRARDPRIVFDGSTAQVVHDFEDKYTYRAPRTFYRLCKNELGEYFLLSSDADPPRIMHLSRERAMNALRIDPAAFKREFGDERTPRS